MELPETWLIIKRWYFAVCKDDIRDEDPKHWAIPIAAVGLLFVILGVGAETVFEMLVSNKETALREHQSQLLGDAQQESGAAELDAASARKETVQLQKDSDGLKRDAAAAQLELARITGKPYSVPVIHGVARPDLSQSAAQFILLSRDTRIILPTLSKGHHLDWTLTIAQNAVGQHQFSSVPFDLSHGNKLFNPPGSSWVCKLTTDSLGTRRADVDCGYNPPNPTSK